MYLHADVEHGGCFQEVVGMLGIHMLLNIVVVFSIYVYTYVVEHGGCFQEVLGC